MVYCWLFLFGSNCCVSLLSAGGFGKSFFVCFSEKKIMQFASVFSVGFFAVQKCRFISNCANALRLVMIDRSATVSETASLPSFAKSWQSLTCSHSLSIGVVGSHGLSSFSRFADSISCVNSP